MLRRVRRVGFGLLWSCLLVAWPGLIGCRAETPPPSADQATQVSIAPDPAPVTRVLTVLNDRLAVMHDVARWKWAEARPIADPEREAQLLNRVAARAQEKNLDPAFVRALFAAQIEASKYMQRADFNRWKASPPPASAVPSLTVLRQRIDAIDQRLLDALAAAGGPLSDPHTQKQVPELADKILTGDGVDPSVRSMVIGPLINR